MGEMLFHVLLMSHKHGRFHLAQLAEEIQHFKRKKKIVDKRVW